MKAAIANGTLRVASGYHDLGVGPREHPHLTRVERDDG